ncbi:hypothetical protein [Candidatus Puniceispirillum marinum]|nr:hypothetical protein [Candidatus Puniceispirillum marinum]
MRQVTGDRLISIENLIGSDHDDVLNGNDGANVMTGGDGNDLFGIDRISTHISAADVITDFAGRSDPAGHTADRVDKIYFGYETGRLLYYALADLDGGGTANDMVIYDDEDGGDNNVLVILQNVTRLSKYDFAENMEGVAAHVPAIMINDGPTVTDIL